MKADNVIIGGGDSEDTCAIESIQKYIDIPGSDPGLTQFNRIVQDKFNAIVSKSFGTICSPNTPIISSITTLYMAKQFKALLPHHYGYISSMLNVTYKLKDKHNLHLANEYDRILMWIFISIMRARNRDLFTWWANVTSAARYGAKTQSARSFNEASYFGHCTSRVTLTRNTAEYRDNKREEVYTDKCRQSITEGHNDFIVMAMNNNQRGHRRKQQRHGTSNTFIVVTHSMAIKPSISNAKETLVALSISRTSITYLGQSVVSLHGMRSYDDRPLTIESCTEFINQKILPKIDPEIDYTGQRVAMYDGFVCYCYFLLQQRKYLSRNKIKFKFISEKAMDDVKNIVSTLNKNRANDGIYKNASLFQKREVLR